MYTQRQSRRRESKLVIVAGFGSLTADIECHLQGHDLALLEAVNELKLYGNIISFGSDGVHICGSWSKRYMLKKFLVYFMLSLI